MRHARRTVRTHADTQRLRIGDDERNDDTQRNADGVADDYADDERRAQHTAHRAYHLRHERPQRGEVLRK